MTRLHFVPAVGAPFDVVLTDGEYAVLQQYCELRRYTLDEAIQAIVDAHMTAPPISRGPVARRGKPS